MDNNIEITTEYITLDAFMKFAAITSSGGEAKMFIKDGIVEVNGNNCTIVRKKLYPGDKVGFNGEIYTVVKNN